MAIQSWWPQLRPETQQWLVANNGDAVPPLIVEEIAGVGGPPASDPWWVDQEGSPGPCMPDEAIDWIEEVANDEADT
jgi:hypothetical protein